VDIVSFETELAYRGVKNVDADRKLLIPNGFDSELPQWYGVERRTFETKENIVLLVGRHGDYAKNSELMLDALENMDHLEGWQVWFVGQMNDAFERRREAFLRQRPELSKQVVFTGQIDDKKELFELYSRSKLLCLTSRWESWGMVCVEAMAFGCVPVMTAVSSAVDITNYGKCGIIIESSDPQYWSNRLREIFSDMSSIKKLSDATREHFQRFEWKKILSHLDKKIKVIISSNTENGRN
jgi:glycosyltransferase involved in cell wall biosynthesis